MRLTLDDAVAELSGDFADHLQLDHASPGRPARVDALPAGLDERVLAGLATRGIRGCWSHQTEALEAIARGEHTVLATPTASGKSLCFHLPVLQGVAVDPATRALFLFPTKALGQDQVNSLLSTSEGAGVPLKVHTFDGDTPSSVRAVVRREAQVVVTNPDMLHAGILPHHPGWMPFFRNLRYVVLDELHTYRGVFGSHVANVLRRLERICAFYGARPQYICGSATIANPGELAEALCGVPFTVVDRNGAPSGPRRLLVACPPLVNKALGIRRSYILFARELLRPFLRAQIPTIVFGLSRLNVEVLLKYLREDLQTLRFDPALAQGYRGGYLPLMRRRIERGLRDGSVRFVVSTSALELGIDIGALQACFVVGYPGTVASFWQQAGRAGRRNEGSVVVYVPRSAPLDQYVAHEPDFLTGASPERARIDPDNPIILAEHLKCGAFELPFEQGEPFGSVAADDTGDMLDALSSYRVLHRAGQRYHWSSRTYPANQVSLRSVPGDNFVVIDREHDRVLAEVDFKSAHTTLHEGAIYNLQSDQYEVLELDYDGHKAFVKRVWPDYYTDAMSHVEVKPLEAETVGDQASNDAKAGRAHLQIEKGEVKVTSKVVGYKKIRFGTNENIGYGEVFLPEITLHTQATWAILPGSLLHRCALDAARAAALADTPMSPEDLALDALLGLSHALHHVAVVRCMCDPRDLGRCVGDRSERWFAPVQGGGAGVGARRGVGGRPVDPFAFDPALFLYDAYPGGVGLCDALADELPSLLRQVASLIARCDCEGGCPACLGAMARPCPPLKAVAGAILAGALEQAA